MESIKNLDKKAIFKIIEKANFFKKNNVRNSSLQNTIVGLLFFEPSTRTCLSFESAIHRLGGKIIKYNYEYSSQKKGESLEDTIRTIETYVDIFVIRHPEKNILSKINKITNKPIINAGDGSGEHPTQSLLDLFTIFDCYKRIPENIGFTGDIKYSRTIHSLVYLLTKINLQNNFYFICNKNLEPEDEFLDFLIEMKSDNKDFNYFVLNEIESVIKDLDVLYVTRLQKERFNGETVKNIIINNDTIKDCKDELIIMHPLPRNEELSTDLDNNKRSKYFEQVNNGVFVRMAIMEYILK
tara:strand:+ start:1709 stop:2599 length:891 start_codon:yes stop_codon:yes gene_type:complete